MICCQRTHNCVKCGVSRCEAETWYKVLYRLLLLLDLRDVGGDGVINVIIKGDTDSPQS